MVTNRTAGLIILSMLVLPLALVGACDKVPLLAPTGSVITLLPATTTVSLNSEINITATVIENGTASGGSGNTTTSSRGGTPVQNGTLVSFTTTIGRIEPSEARTHNGQVTVKLITGSASGTATITAFSGGASTTKDLRVGTAAARTVLLTTTPQTLGASGGTVQVQATVTDEGGSSVGGVPVTFATDKGSVSPSTTTTDANGVATATLTTTATAKVTATAGTVKSNDATVTVSVRGLASFVADPTSAAAGVPVKFTVTPTTGANVSNVRVNFGDGGFTDLGAVTGATSTTHAYSSPGNYTPTATSTDPSGDSGTLSTNVIIGALGVTLTATPNPTTVGVPTALAVGGLGTAQVDRYIWTFDDGTPQQTTTSPQNTHAWAGKGPKFVRVDVIGVNGGIIGTATVGVQVN